MGQDMKPDRTEQLTSQYLNGLGIGPVVYEPDGNVPPDFSVAGVIGVEARRLNHNYETPHGAMEGLEELSVRLWQRLRRYLREFAPSRNGECWYVYYKFRRPLEETSKLLPKIRAELLAFMNSPDRCGRGVAVTRNFDIVLERSCIDHGSFFVLGMSTDEDVGGWVMAEVERNVRICIAEKERKIAPYRARYREWWLVLVDHIDYGIDPEDRDHFRNQVMPRILHSFDRVVLLDPRDHQRALEICP